MTTPTTPSASAEELEAAKEIYTANRGLTIPPYAAIIAKHTRCEGKTAQEWHAIADRQKQLRHDTETASYDAHRRAEQAEALLREVEHILLPEAIMPLSVDEAGETLVQIAERVVARHKRLRELEAK
ncbi:hypothetical protein HQ590_02295 [bacterium]|nr:hypothetical protein [bacterium]